MKGATCLRWRVGLKRLFQSALPRRERHDTLHDFDDALDFNPRSREGSDDAVAVPYPVDTISIHALVKGATTTQSAKTINLSISIHAPVKGATCIMKDTPNPKGISIHAPAKGATAMSINAATCATIFQSTLPRRERPAPCAARAAGEGFQSTLPRRERRDSAYKTPHDNDFNPRSREGSDHQSGKWCKIF